MYFYMSVILILGFGKTTHYQQGDAKDTNGDVALGTEMRQLADTYPIDCLE